MSKPSSSTSGERKSSAFESQSSLAAQTAVRVEKLRAEAFKRLNGITYLDHAGAALYSEVQMQEVLATMRDTVFSNPHSQSLSGQNTGSAIDRVRDMVLQFFNTSGSEYSVVFTSGTTAALKLVGELFPWSSRSEFCYLLDNHNSVLGIREYAKQHGAAFSVVDAKLQCACSSALRQQSSPAATAAAPASADLKKAGETGEPVYSLFAFPAESNFSGERFDLGLVAAAQQGRLTLGHRGHSADAGAGAGAGKGETKAKSKAKAKSAEQAAQWLVLVDAAKFCCTRTLDLSKCPADFVALSFYKMFGYPTGLGALLVRNRRNTPTLGAGARLSASGSADSGSGSSSGGASRLLPGAVAESGSAAALLCSRKRYFGGGTVEASTSADDFFVRRAEPARWLEDGTLPFAAIAALEPGFSLLRSLGMEQGGIAAHTAALTRQLAEGMLALRHRNGAQLCELYGRHGSAQGSESQGPVVTFNLRAADGSYVGYTEVEKLAAAANIHIRTGCFCNPGACQFYLNLTPDMVKEHNRQGHKCWDDTDVIGGRPTGACRVSLGFSSTQRDVQTWLAFLRTYFLSDAATTKQEAKEAKRDTETRAASAAAASAQAAAKLTLSEIVVFPIKSCGGQSVREWPLGARGLLLDREWTLVDESGAALSMKRLPAMCLLRPALDLARGTLTVTAPEDAGLQPLVLPIATSADSGWGSFSAGSGSGSQAAVTATATVLSVGGVQRSGLVYGPEVSRWFSQALGRSCHLARIAAPSPSAAAASKPSAQQNGVHAEVKGAPSIASRALAFGSELLRWVSGKPSDAAAGAAGRGTKRKADELATEAQESERSAKRAKLGSDSQSGSSSSEASFANEGEYLCVSQASVDAVRELSRQRHAKMRLETAGSGDDAEADAEADADDSAADRVVASRFRGNLVVSGGQPFQEDRWRALRFADLDPLEVVAPCVRCTMVNIDQQTGDRRSNVFAVLAAERKREGKIVFGVLLRNPATDTSNGVSTSASGGAGESKRSGSGSNHGGSSRDLRVVRVGMPVQADLLTAGQDGEDSALAATCSREIARTPSKR